MSGKLVAIEGLDKAGKSYLVSKLVTYLTNLGVRVEYIHFPTTDKEDLSGRIIKEYLSGRYGNNLSPYFVATLYANNRYLFSPIIRSWLNEGKIIIFDRYLYSAMALQSIDIPDDELEEFWEWLFMLEYKQYGIPVPNINIYIDTPLSVIEERLNQIPSQHKDIHENIDFQRKAQKRYYLLVDRYDNFVKVSSTPYDPDSIFNQLIDILRQYNIIGMEE